MRLKNTDQITAFRTAINACKGSVWLESTDGDKFDLKSTFSQYIAIGAMLRHDGDKLELFCGLPEDEANFYAFFAQNPGVN